MKEPITTECLSRKIIQNNISRLIRPFPALIHPNCLHAVSFRSIHYRRMEICLMEKVSKDKVVPEEIGTVQ